MCMFVLSEFYNQVLESLIRINLYLGFKDSMKLIDDKDVKSRLSLFYSFIGISNKFCICYNMKVFTSLSSISFIESLKPRYKLILINIES